MTEPTMGERTNIKLPIYLDNQSTTPLDARVLEAMMPYLTEKFGNPHSQGHAYGREAAEAVERARAEVAAIIGADAREIIFTSGATESNNLSLKGTARFYRDRRRHIVTVQTEHKCVIETCRDLEREGFEVTFLPVDGHGLIDLDRLRAAITDRTALVSVMGVNNEIGVIQPLADIGRICAEMGAFFHTDAAQAVGKIPLDVNQMGIDLMSISGHKIYGPKGVGALYVRRRPRVRLEPLFSGGGQERGLRSGTLPAHLCVGMGAACRIAEAGMADESARTARLRDRLHAGIAARVPEVILNGDPERRVAGNLNLSFAGIDAEALMAEMTEVAVSSGSACSSAAIEPSYVLRALGLEDALAQGSIRFGVGRFNTEAEINDAIEAVAGHVARLRAGAAPQKAIAWSGR